jgi:pimeloyl-ACP methyl ester carboxylesterase
LKWREIALASAGLLLCVAGYFLSHAGAGRPLTVLATAGGCNMPTDIYEPRSGELAGSVVLLHGLSANKKVMAFTAQEFSNLNLRVFVPDQPGHGKTPGPFSPARAESCVAALVRDLAARKAILPERTLLVGHSMGGAIAARVAAQIPVTGVIAISPAPMEPSPEVAPELLLFPSHPPLPPRSLVLSASAEPAAIRRTAERLVTDPPNPTSRYAIIPNSSHVSILFDAGAFQQIRAWSAQLLGTSNIAEFPKSRPALGCLVGILGLSLLTPPFLREIVAEGSVDSGLSATPSAARTLLTILLLSIFAVVALRLVMPANLVRLFQGAYLTDLLFLTGIAAVLLHRQALPPVRNWLSATTLGAVAAGILLVLLFGAWFEVTFHEAWLTFARWARFPLLVLLFLPWHIAEESVLGPLANSPDLLRTLLALAARSVVWLIAVAAVFQLRSGQFIFVLLPGYFLFFSILQRLAIDVVRLRTRSLPAAALFGAILLAGFVLAILPVA